MSELTTRASKGSALIHAELDTNFKQGQQTKAGAYTVLVSDNRDTIEVSATATITLPDASTIAAASDTGDFEVTIKNLAGTTTIGRVTGANTIDGTAADITLESKGSVTLKVNQAGNGYNTDGDYVGKILTSPTLTSPIISGDVTGSVITLNSPVATTTGTSVDITSIPSWAKKITIMLNGVSTNGTSDYILQIGDAGGIEATGYKSGVLVCSLVNASFYESITGFLLANGVAAVGLTDGSITLSLQESSSFTWVEHGTLQTIGNFGYFVTGKKSLTAALTQVRLTTVSGTDTFDAGNVSIMYE